MMMGVGESEAIAAARAQRGPPPHMPCARARDAASEEGPPRSARSSELRAPNPSPSRARRSLSRAIHRRDPSSRRVARGGRPQPLRAGEQRGDDGHGPDAACRVRRASLTCAVFTCLPGGVRGGVGHTSACRGAAATCADVTDPPRSLLQWAAGEKCVVSPAGPSTTTGSLRRTSRASSAQPRRARRQKQHIYCRARATRAAPPRTHTSRTTIARGGWGGRRAVSRADDEKERARPLVRRLRRA